MKGLLIKDFKLLITNMKYSLLMIVLIAVGISAYTTDTTFVIVYLSIIGTSFTTSTLSYDEFDNGYAFLFSLPVTRRGYIAEKYIFGLCMSSIGWLIGTIATIIAGMSKSVMPMDTIQIALALLPLEFLFIAFLIPFHLKFGGDKGRIIMIGALGLMFLLITIGSQMLKSVQIDWNAIGKNLPSINEGTAIALFFAIGLALLFLSCAISVRIMEKKEF